VQENTDGFNLYVPFVNEKTTGFIKSQSGLVGVWWHASHQQENDEMYKLVMQDCGVDFFFSDKPLEAMAYRKNLVGKDESTL